jgi:hypothetical protein
MGVLLEYTLGRSPVFPFPGAWCSLSGVGFLKGEPDQKG